MAHKREKGEQWPFVEGDRGNMVEIKISLVRREKEKCMQRQRSVLEREGERKKRERGGKETILIVKEGFLMRRGERGSKREIGGKKEAEKDMKTKEERHA